MRLKQVDLMKTTSVITRSGETLRYVSHFEQFKKLAWHNSDLKHSHAASCSLSEKYQSCVVVEVINLKLTTYFSDYFSRRFACQIVCLVSVLSCMQPTGSAFCYLRVLTCKELFVSPPHLETAAVTPLF